MIVAMNTDQFNYENVVLHEPVKNQIFNDSTFMRIVYSNNIITTSGVYLKLDIKGASMEKRFNKTTIVFNVYNNTTMISRLQIIERLFLSTIKNRVPVYGIFNELITGRIVVHDYTDTIVLKISGVWETDTNCGVTYKFV